MVWPWCEFEMQVWNVVRAALCKYRAQKIAKNSPSRHRRTALLAYIFATKARIDNRKKLVKQQYLLHMSHNMVNFGPLAAEIGSVIWGTPPNVNGFRVLAALLHGTLVVGVSQTLRRWTKRATYIRQGGHHVGHWPTFLVRDGAPQISPLLGREAAHATQYVPPVRDGTGSPGNGSPGQPFWPGRVGSRVSVSDPVFDPVLSFNTRVYRGVVCTE